MIGVSCRRRGASETPWTRPRPRLMQRRSTTLVRLVKLINPTGNNVVVSLFVFFVTILTSNLFWEVSVMINVYIGMGKTLLRVT